MKISKSIVTEIVINASPEVVWDILVNLENYEKWNPFIIKSKGVIQVKSRLENVMVNGKGTITFRPVVQRVEKGEYFDWIGRLLVPGIFDGHHYFKIETIAAKQVKLVQGENFGGILATLILRKIGQETRRQFVRMNQALKKEAENIN